MLIVLSPAKTLDYDTPSTTEEHTFPDFIEHAAELIGALLPLSPADLSNLMGISDTLAVLNVTRYAAWSRRFTKENTKQAILAFNGDVYEGLEAASLSNKQLGYAQSHIRILSGLYGVLRPLDLMQPYRLEMGTRLANARGKDLYAFWGSLVTDSLNKAIAAHRTKVLVNLASEEYFKAVKPKELEADVITPVFEDWRGGRYKVISFYAKRARGLMARYAAQKGIVQPEKLKAFDAEGYAFDEKASGERTWVFRRRVE
ncbi:peroxide stress protein YaaA [Herbaspirillum sp. HC18]|nr:peroxide stress protein YaaA [Herbaspirillum sp. HC18]